MATNPNPTRISAEMWRFWEEFKKIEPTVKLGGVYANKYGYHNYRSALSSKDYSVQLPADKLGPSDKAAAIDLTFPDAQAGNFKTINKYSLRLLKSGYDMKDDRGNYLREFYGNTDTDRQVEGWDFQRLQEATSDDSHLWHIHLSFLRKYLNDRRAFDAVLSILKGESFATYKARLAAPVVPKPAVVKAKATDFKYPYQIILEVLKFLPKPYTVTDTTRSLNGPIAKGVWDWHVGNSAVDYSGTDKDMRDNSEWFIRYAPRFLEYIHTTPYSTDHGYYAKNMKRVGEYFYSEKTKNAHLDHCHVAMNASNALATLNYFLDLYYKTWKWDVVKKQVVRVS